MEGAHTQSERHERRASGRADATDFPALAEARRRAGHPDEALKVADEGLRGEPDRVAGRVARALALLDLGREADARRELESVLHGVPAATHPGDEDLPPRDAGEALAGFDEDELDDAFAGAEAEPDEMHDANRVAEATLRALDGDRPEGVFAAGPDSPFVTETVAGLLERQGDRDSARAIRRALDERGARGGTGRPVDRERVSATLERWLSNLRRRMG